MSKFQLLSIKVGRALRWLLVGGALAFFVSFVGYMAPKFFTAPKPIVDLVGAWEICVPRTDPRLIGTADCNWISAHAPGGLPGKIQEELRSWLVYRKRFGSPESCRDGGCTLTFGEIGDAVEARLNGGVIGRRGGLPPEERYGKQYPVSFDLPSKLFSPSGGNELTLFVYSLKKPQSGLRYSPAAIVRTEEAFSFTQAAIAHRIVFPLVGALVLLCVFVFGLLFVGRRSTPERPLMGAYFRYCFASALFLVSFSEMPREYLPFWLAVHLHFFARYLSDWMFFELVVRFFNFKGRVFRIIRLFYPMALMAFASSGVWFGVGSDEARYSIGAGAPYEISSRIFVLKLIPMLLGLWGACRSSRGNSRGLLVALFSVLSLMQLNDICVFLGVYSHVYYVKFYPVVAALILGGLLIKRMQAAEMRRERRVASDLAVSRIAGEVSHNISAPVRALEMMLPILNGVSDEQRRVIRNAVHEIRDMIHTLKAQSETQVAGGGVPGTGVAAPSTRNATVQLLPELVEAVVSNSRVRFRDVSNVDIGAELDEQSYGLFAKVESTEFKAIFSNLVKNGVEALPAEGGKVTVSVSRHASRAVVEVCDTGKGIEPDVLDQLGAEGATFGKPNGSGIGLHHAKSTVERWGGHFEIQSKVGTGTTVRIALPLSSPPEWFVPAIEVRPESVVVVLDDNIFARQLWRSRFAKEAAHVRLFEFNCSDTLRAWVETAPMPAETIFLIDYELGREQEDGLRVIERLGIADCSILVTGHFGEPSVMAKARWLGVRVLPKSVVPWVPIRSIEAAIGSALLSEIPRLG